MSLRKLFLTTSAAALLAGTAHADGGPAPDAPPPPPPEDESYTPPPPAPAAVEAIWYADLHGGVVWLNDMVFDTGGSLIGSDIDPGWSGGGALGYRYPGGFRTEIEGTYRYNEGLAFEILNPFINAPEEISSLSFMLNVIYDFDLGSFLTPYIGAGIGANRVNINFVGEAEDDGWAFAWQGIAGFSVPLPNTAIELYADYRYMSTWGLDLDFGNNVLDHDEYESHNVIGGFRINF